MNPLVDDAWDQISGSWRFRWPGIASAAVLALVGWLFVFGLEDRYEAEASVFVDPHTPLQPALKDLSTEQNSEAELNFVRQSLLADATLQQIARAVHVVPARSTDEQLQQLLTAMRRRVEISVRSASGREEDRNTAGSIYHLVYWDHDRSRSLRVVRILLDSFIKGTLGGEREGAENAQQFLQAQISDVQKRLREAEDRLTELKSKQSEQQGYLAELREESKAVAGVNMKLAEARSRRTTLSRQLDELAATSVAPDPTAAPGSKGALDTLSLIKEAQEQLDELLRKYTDKHPDVIAAQQRLEDLNRRLSAEMKALRRADPAATPGNGASTNPVYQKVRTDLYQVEVDIEDMTTALRQHESRVVELRRYVDTGPKVDAELAQLNRDYDANKALLANLQKGLLAQQAASAGSVRFKILQPPVAPYRPIWPRRRLYLAAVLVAAVAAGTALAYGLNYLFPVVHSGGSLARIIGVPVLGEVAGAFPERERRAFHRDLLRVSMATACLLMAFAAALVLSQAGYRLSIMALEHLVHA